MELQFNTETLSCLDQVIHEIQNQEQTQELRLPDGMPDIGRVVSAWAQAIVRSKEWRSDNVTMSGGLMVWVLYAPEDGTQEQWVDSWIPFQMKWDIPKSDVDGVIRILCQPRFVDARVISARKLMIRAGVSAMAEGLLPMKAQLYAPEEVPEDVQLLTNSYPLRLFREAGEKEFLLDEDLMLPGACPAAEKIVYYTVSPEITEQRISADKVIFRGNTNLHILYRSEEGKLHSCDLQHPFSQLAQLEGTYSPDAQTDVALGVTSLELSLEDEGNLRLKCGLVGQYRVDDRQMVRLVEDAYSPTREIRIRTDDLKLPAILETRQERLHVEQSMDQTADSVVDTVMRSDQPRQIRTGDSVKMELPGQCGVLFYGADGVLRSSSAHWEQSFAMDADEASELELTVQNFASPQSSITADGISVKGDCLISISTMTSKGMPMVTGLELGELREADPGRPSLILRRVGNKGLWELAKESGSTVDAICRANKLDGEPERGRMLLIPVV